MYGGKIAAALTRQHPRDLFDILLLLKTKGMNEDLKNTFLFYLISSSKPFYEVLNPNQKEIEPLFLDKFLGMEVGVSTTISSLDRAFKDLVLRLKKFITEKDILFLSSLLSLNPKWDLYAFPKIKNYPSIKWRLFNLEKMSKAKRNKEIAKLEKYIQGGE